MTMERFMFFLCLIYVSCVAGSIVKFVFRGVRGWFLLVAFFAPSFSVVVAILAPFKFLVDKKEVSIYKKATEYIFLVYVTLKMMPLLVDGLAYLTCTAQEYRKEKEKEKEKIKIRAKESKRKLWSDVVAYYNRLTPQKA